MSVLGPTQAGDDPEISAYGKFRQIQREIDARISSLSVQQTVVYDLELKLLEQQQLEKSFWCWTRKQKLKKLRASTEIERIRWELSQNLRTAKDVQRELEFYVDQGLRVVEIVRNWSPEKRREIEELWWICKFERRLRAAAMYGRPAVDVVEMIADLPSHFRQHLENRLNHPKLVESPYRLQRILSEVKQSYGEQQRIGTPKLESGTSGKVARIQCAFPSEALAYQASRSGCENHSANGLQ